MIRKMTEKDLIEIQALDKTCFKISYTRCFNYLEALLTHNASLVYEDKGKIVGYVFNHVLGTFGWFGTLGVDQDHRGKNIGKELVTAATNTLKNEFKVETIGIVTMPESSYNIGFYINLGFTPKESILRLKKKLNSKDICNIKNENIEVQFVNLNNSSEYKRIILLSKKISNNLYRGLDMSPEFSTAGKSGLGIGFIIYEDKKPVGFCLLRKPIFVGEVNNIYIRLLCINNQCNSQINILNIALNKIYKYSFDAGYKNIFIDINTLNYDICSYLLKDHNFKIVKPSLSLFMGNKSFFNEINGLMLFKTAM